ncbi:phospholipid/cholesterol/gamma-HCH transport system substrate-binding protein [Stackebrandtia albiflava]|uniref:Phospholipid/cholesterol/gamma-HCH transport system substrate-binding protein n=1 Tax=Stackebrandtia albiflava TaxID=406432 RepID=A0A562V3D5_9ACTN|nr:phospholipid/cholesterol/gamma-HCH transport system substrate-binding protein [Stackebrandtia albiflava]
MARRSGGPGTVGSGVRLGIFALVTTLALVLLTDALGGVRLSGGPGYTALFTDATGLLPGDEVRIAGVKVGEVDDIRLRQDAGAPPVAEVSFSLEDDRPLPSDVHATIRYRNLVGQRYVALTRSSADSTGATLSPGDTIGLERTSPALDLTLLLNGFKPLFAALSPEEVNELSYEIIQVLQGEGSTIEGILSHTASLTSTLAAHDDTIGAVIDNLNEVLATVASREDALDTSIVRLQDFISGLSADRDALGEAVVSMSELTGQTADLVAEARPPLAADVSALETLATTLNANAETLETTLARLPVTYTELTTTGSYGSWFNFFLCDMDGQVSVGGLSANPVGFHSPFARCQED